MLTVAIIGRPNVGKSTFFNRVLNQRKAIVHEKEGITRDRIYGEMFWTGHQLRFVDTGGFIPKDSDIFNREIRNQAKEAANEADFILFIVDGKTGPVSTDVELANFVRKSGKKHLMAVNKCDDLSLSQQINNFFELGLKPVLPISALNGRLTGDLLDEIIHLSNIKLSENKKEADDSEFRLAITGMPNVGKSSLLNAILKRNQSIVTPIGGTTRDAIDSNIRYYGKKITLVDTAGLRKKSKISDNIEFYSTIRTQNAILNCDLALVLIDAEKGFTKHDKSIIDDVILKGKGLIVIVNKWDLINKTTNTMKEFVDEMIYQFKTVGDYPILFISALTKKRISGVLKEASLLSKKIKKKLSTSDLNKSLQKALSLKAPPATKGKVINLNYITQVSTKPHLFVIYANYPKLVPLNYRKYLENNLRSDFDLKGIPFRISFRKK